MSKPWYRQFWPWFLIALPAMSVAGSVTALVYALEDADPVVRDDWYKSGVLVNRDLHLDREAVRRGLSATIATDDSGRELRISLAGEGSTAVASLRVELTHLRRADNDRTLHLVRAEDGLFRLRLEEPLAGTWNATLVPADHDWRLLARLRFPLATGQVVSAAS